MYPTFFNNDAKSSHNIYYRNNSLTSINNENAGTDKSGMQLVKDINEIFDFASDYYAHFGELKNAAQQLKNAKAESAFGKRAVEVDDPHILRAEAEPGASVDYYEVSVDALAVAQEEVSGFFKRDKAVMEEFGGVIEEGEYTFRITQNGREETFTVEIKESLEEDEDDYKTFQGVFKQIADKINESSLDITARYGRERGLSSEMRLVLTADEPGTTEAFTIRDIPGKVEGVTGLMEHLGMEQVQEAKDVEVDITGVEKHKYFSRGDKIHLISDHGVELDLKETGQTFFEVIRDVKGVKDSLEQFTITFGNVLNFMEQTRTNGDLERLKGRLADIARDERDSLRSVGIDVDEAGVMRIDKSLFDGLLEKKLEEDFTSVEELFSGLHGIASRVESFSDEALKMTPLRFMHEPREVDLFDFVKDSYDMSGRGMYQLTSFRGLVLDMML